MLFADRHDRQAVAALCQDHVVEPGVCLDFGECNRLLQLANKLDVYEYPSRFVLRALRVEVFRISVELRVP